VDSIPGLIAAFTPGGRGRIRQPPILEYFGKTLEELRQWGPAARHILRIFANRPNCSPGRSRPAILSSSKYALGRFDGVYRWFRLADSVARPERSDRPLVTTC
jgi:hypothetical protein